MASAKDKPNILLLSLSCLEYFDDVYKPLISRLLDISYLTRVKTTSTALKAIDSTNFKAVIVTDEGLADPENRVVLVKLKDYIESRGLAIVGLRFSNFIRLDRFKVFFKAFGLTWVPGNYHAKTICFVPSNAYPRFLRPASLPGQRTVNVRHVQNPRPHEKIFVPIPDAKRDNDAEAGRVVNSESAVTGARIGHDDLVYCGDVNGGVGSARLILALCGFLTHLLALQAQPDGS
ncbi:hypothetical protein N7481_008836 [Penicillium waksmanii]|uniref:uncharacterized protein n=1 Tax=Penicillium waksmanii TaxID=69791 RepID=UPI0025479E7E|nr:uncharacterized protein N7481_008836 [Penicillium waksmanii]KAJ5975129.1 hypothetical protein N7481_008836 [Penicillium waksmanii]